jgi:hypothetical protein
MGLTDISVPTSKDLFRLTEHEEALQRALVIGTPTAPEETPPSLFFERKRDVDIPWKQILSGIKGPVEESVDALRIDLENSLGLEETPLGLLEQDDVDRIFPSFQALGPQPSSEEGAEPDTVQVYRSAFEFVPGKDAEGDAEQVKATIATKAEPVETGIVCRHGSGRAYLIIPSEGAALTLEDLADRTGYVDAWRNRIAGLELVYMSATEAENYASAFEEIDLSAAVIESKMHELLALREFQDELVKKADAAIDAMLSTATQGDIALDEIEAIQNKALQLKMRSYTIRQRIDRLIGQASQLGYLLFDKEEETHTLPDGKKVKIEAGTLYRKYQRIARWTTISTLAQVVRQMLRVLFLKIVTKKTIRHIVQQQHSCIVDDYEKVDTSKDQLEERAMELRREGFDVHVFRETAQGYLSEDNAGLEAIMDECGRDEAIRRRCTVILPIYQKSVIGQRALVKYHVFLRPLPGVQPVAMPRLTLIESLSYRIAWMGVQIGELASALNLAPGESRTISLRKEYETETTISESRSSVFDLDRQESSDLSDEMERQMRVEAEHSDETSMSLEVKGNYGFVSGSANASHGSKNSLKNFSQGINKVAKKSSQSVNRKQREEVSTTSTSRTRVSTFDETTAKIENINQGRTLNLMFYRLYNKLKSGLYIEGLKFQILSSTEIIAGSGVLRFHTYTFDTFAEMVDEFRAVALPVRISESDRFHYLYNVLDAIDSLLREEYKRVTGKGRRAAAADGAAHRTASVLTMPDAASVDAAAVGVDDGYVSEAEIRAQQLKEHHDKEKAELDRLEAEAEETKARYAAFLKKRAELAGKLKVATLDANEPLDGTAQELLVVAPGLYLDAALGVQPGTEPYSEAMRQQRVRQEAAEVALKAADARYKLALAARLRDRTGDPAGNWIVGVLPDPEGGTLTLRFKQPLEEAAWQLYVDGTSIQVDDTDRTGDYTLVFKLTDGKAVLARDDLMSSLVELRDEHDGRLVSSVV